jgi:hypothetical protein
MAGIFRRAIVVGGYGSLASSYTRGADQGANRGACVEKCAPRSWSDRAVAKSRIFLLIMISCAGSTRGIGFLNRRLPSCRQGVQRDFESCTGVASVHDVPVSQWVARPWEMAMLVLNFHQARRESK